MNADQIISAARECVGTKFAHQGRIVGVGLDCAGVVVHVAKSLGLDVLDQMGYGRNPHDGSLESAADAQQWLYRVEEMKPGDVLMMKFTNEPQHVGVFTGENIIQGYEKVRKVVEHRLDSRWALRVVRVYRFKGLT